MGQRSGAFGFDFVQPQDDTLHDWGIRLGRNNGRCRSVLRSMVIHARSVLAALLALCVPGCCMAQDRVTLKAGTPVVLSLANAVKPATLKPGDAVGFKLLLPLRVDGILVAKAGTPVVGHVVATQPELVVMMQAVPLAGGAAEMPLTGNPFALVKGKLAEVKVPDSPTELASHGHVDAADVATLAAVGAIAVPLIAVAAPFWLLSKAAGGKKHEEQELVYRQGQLVQVSLTTDVAVPRADLAGLQNVYAGQPVIYLVDRYFNKRSDIGCGRDVLLGKPESRTNLYRVEEGSYPFHTAKSGDLKAKVEAKADHRYLVYRDGAGLHPVDLEGRPDLLDRLPVINEQTKWNFDITAVEPGQRQSVADDRARGGCGIVKMLRVRAK